MQHKSFHDSCSYVSQSAALSRKTSKRLTAKNTKTPLITRVEPDGIVVKTNSGVTKVYFTELPKEVQERFHYDSGKGRRHILPSRPPITPHIKSSRRKPDVNNRTPTQRTRRH